MQVKAYKLSSFTQSLQGGNPAGVIIDAAALENSQKQKLAERIGFSETAFLHESEKGTYNVSFFTPCAEVDLCGHATIAAFSLLQQLGLIQDGVYFQNTKAGRLKMNVSGKTVFMQQTKPQFFEKIESKELLDSLGIGSTDLDPRLPVQAVSTGLKDIFIPVKSPQILEKLKPDMEKIAMISKGSDAVGYHVFAVCDGEEKIAICRNFAPLYGIPEESATGTSNGALACYLYKYGMIDGRKEYAIEQGISMQKPSRINARLYIENKEINEIWIGGEAILIGEEQYEL